MASGYTGSHSAERRAVAEMGLYSFPTARLRFNVHDQRQRLNIQFRVRVRRLIGTWLQHREFQVELMRSAVAIGVTRFSLTYRRPENSEATGTARHRMAALAG